MRYAFVAEHRQQFTVRTMCRCLSIHPSGFYAWLKSPLSKRAQEDIRQTQLIEEAWKQSGKVYGYRKLHDDLLDQGETSCANRIARLARLAGIKAQIGYRRRPGSYGGKPSVVVDNTLARQFDVEAPDTAWVTDITHIKTMEGFAYLAVVIDLFSRRGLVATKPADQRGRSSGPAHGGLAPQAPKYGVGPFRPGLSVHQHGLGQLPAAPQSGSLHEPARQLPRQCRGRELL